MQLLRFPYFSNFLARPSSDSLYQFYKNSHLYSLMELTRARNAYSDSIFVRTKLDSSFESNFSLPCSDKKIHSWRKLYGICIVYFQRDENIAHDTTY